MASMELERGAAERQEGIRPIGSTIVMGESLSSVTNYLQNHTMRMDVLPDIETARNYLLSVEGFQADVFITTLGVQKMNRDTGYRDEVQAVDAATLAKNYSPKALLVFVTSIPERFEHNPDFHIFDLIVQKDKMEEAIAKEAANEEGKRVKITLKDFLIAAIKAKQEGIPLPENIYRERSRANSEAKAKTADTSTLTPQEAREAALQEAVAVSQWTKKVKKRKGQEPEIIEEMDIIPGKTI